MFSNVHPVAFRVLYAALGHGAVNIGVCRGAGRFFDGLHAGHLETKVVDALGKIRRVD